MIRPAALVLTLLLAACGTSPAARLYTLSVAAPPANPAAQGANVTIAVGPVTVPESVDRPQLLVREDANRVTIAEQHRWAEPLKGEIARVVAENLSHNLPGARVATWTQNAAIDADRRVTIDVQRFDSTLGGEVVVEALWSVRGKSGASRNGRSLMREPVHGQGYEALVAAHSRALATMSREIAAALR